MTDDKLADYNQCLDVSFYIGAEINRLEEITKLNGIEGVAEFATDYALATLMAGLKLDVNADDDEFFMLMEAFEKGKELVSPASFKSPLLGGKIRSTVSKHNLDAVQ